MTLCQNTKVKKPENYKKESVIEVYNTYDDNNNREQNITDDKRPTVIAIMNESWSDLNIIHDFESNPDYMPFWHSFDTPVMKGDLLVSVHGSRTCNTEFEFLTGASMRNLPRWSYPYQQYSLKTLPSLAREFKNNGYDTVAIHPGKPENWNRKNALLNLGFDRFIDKNDFIDPEYIGYFISDKSCYDKIIEEFKNKEKEKFIFAVTIQNHGGYNSSRFNNDEMVQLGSELNTYTDAREYLTLIQKADQALESLFTYFEKIDEPVIICIFGDHQPYLDEEFYEKLYGHSLKELSSEEEEKRYMTPYLIWSNYDTGIQKERKNTSANFLGTLLLNASGILENPFYEYYDEILDICREYDVTISLGDACRPGCLADASDVCQIEELVRLGELTKRAWEKDVQVMVEGPGHMPMDQIAANMKIQQTICMGAPFYVLGPLVTDIAPGYDHITSAIGGAIAAANGAAFLCYVTPAEHLALPNVDDVKQGIMASKIAAHAADIAKHVPGAMEMDNKMADARRVLDWEAQWACAMDPETAKAIRADRAPEQEDTCSMCGKFCAVRSMNKALNGEYIDIL